tara:strand:- start:149 stop:373 length:225 start_codon:yes stop_codon:yes gene_type:complete
MRDKIKQSKTTYKDGGFLTDKSLNNIRQQLQKRGKYMEKKITQQEWQSALEQAAKEGWTEEALIARAQDILGVL